MFNNNSRNGLVLSVNGFIAIRTLYDNPFTGPFITSSLKKIRIDGDFARFEYCGSAYSLNFTNTQLTKIDRVDWSGGTEYNLESNSLVFVLVTTIANVIDTWNGLYNVSDTCTRLTNQMNQQFIVYGLQTRLTPTEWTFYVNNKRVTFEEALKILPIGAPLRESNSNRTLNLSGIIWHQESINMALNQGADDNSYSVIPDETTYFYKCAYICPTCGRNMGKALINPSSINVAGRSSKMKIDKVFSCKYCHTFYAPLFNMRLDCGSVYYLKTDASDYNDVAKALDNCGRDSTF